MLKTQVLCWIQAKEDRANTSSNYTMFNFYYNDILVQFSFLSNPTGSIAHQNRIRKDPEPKSLTTKPKTRKKKRRKQCDSCTIQTRSIEKLRGRNRTWISRQLDLQGRRGWYDCFGGCEWRFALQWRRLGFSLYRRHCVYGLVPLPLGSKVLTQPSFRTVCCLIWFACVRWNVDWEEKQNVAVLVVGWTWGNRFFFARKPNTRPLRALVRFNGPPSC